MLKFKIWLGVIFSFLLKFGTPAGIAYWKFAIYKEGVGGSFFFFVVGIIFAAFYIKLRGVIKKQKASRTKVVFKLFLTMTTGAMLYGITSYIGTNFTELIWVILSWLAGYLLASIIDFFVVNLDKDYLEEIGVI